MPSRNPNAFLPPFLSPVILGTTLGPFNSVGADLTADGLVFRNPNRTAMLVDQLRFSGAATTTWGNAVAMGIEVRLGSIPLTNNLVTLASLAPRYTGYQGGLDANIVPVNSGGDQMLTWHLLKPLYVPPGVPLIVRAVRQRVIAGSTYPGNIATIKITLAGRSLPKDFAVPKGIDIPWVTETKCNENVARYVSKDSDLVNPFATPLNVRQFVGSNMSNVSAVGKVFNVNPANLTCQMTASNGQMFVRDPVPFFVLFPASRGVLNVEAKLQAGEFFRSELEVQSIPTGGEADLQTCQFTSIAMHGYRRIHTPQGVPTP